MKATNETRESQARAMGGRSPAPVVSVWGPVLGKGLAALVAAGVLAIIGIKAGASPGPVERVALPVNSTVAAPALPAATEPASDGGAPVSAREGREGGAAATGVLSDGRVILNTAEADDLVKLPGIGPSRAQAILALRHRLGRFRAVDDLMRVKGIGRKTLRRLRPSLLVDPAPPNSAEKDAG